MSKRSAIALGCILGLLRFAPGAAGQVERDCIREVSGIVIDGDLSDWSRRPYRVLGSMTPSETELSAVSWLGWSRDGVYVALRTYTGESHPAGAGASDTVDIFLDMRTRSARMDRFEPGVAHYILSRREAGATSVAAAPNAGKGGPALAEKIRAVWRARADGWNLECLVPWASVGGGRPEPGSWVGAGVRITRNVGASQRIVIGDDTVDPQNPIETTPLAFSAFRIMPKSPGSRPFEYRTEEVVIQGEPWIEVEAIAPVEFSTVHGRGIRVRSPGVGIDADLPFVTSPSGHYRVARDRYPLPEAGGIASPLGVELADADDAWSVNAWVPVPVAVKFGEIEAALPENPPRPLAEPENGVVHVLKAAARESATLLCTAPDGYRPPQRICRPRFEPGIYDGQIALFVQEAQAMMRAKQLPPDYPLRGWQSAIDGSWLPIEVIYPWNFQPGRKYPAKLMLYGFVRDADTVRFVQAAVRTEYQGADEYGESDSFQIRLFGRGNAEAALDEEELAHVLDRVVPRLPVDPRRVAMYGDSAGANSALQFVLDSPGRFAWLHARAGGFAFLLRDGDDIVKRLRNFAHGGVYLEAGGKDTAIARANQLLADHLDRAGVPEAYREYPDEGHFFPPGQAPERIRKIEIPRRPNRVSFATDTVDHGHAYWITIDVIDRWGAMASIDAGIEGKRLHVAPKNVRAFSLDFSAFSNSEFPLSVAVDGSTVVSVGSKPEHPLSLFLSPSGWSASPPPAQALKTRGQCGPARSIEDQPLLLVYGTRDELAAPWLRARAFAIMRALCGHTESSQREAGRFDLLADRDVSAGELKSHNLWIIGGPRENSLAARLGGLSGAVARDGFSLAGRRFRSGALLFSYLSPDPFASGHYIYVECGSSPPAYLNRVLPRPECDACVQTIENGESRILWAFDFSTEWAVPSPPDT